MITHYDLFAGIGGFSLALEEVFNDATIRHIFCEWESFPTAVLRQHWPDGEFYGDIAELVTDTNSQRKPNRLSKVQEADGEIPQRYNNAEPSNPDKQLVTHTSSIGRRGRSNGDKTRSRRSVQTSGRDSSFTIVTGGFPCQPFSHAGRRKGTADDRYQWPNMYEVIRNTSPDWVIAENVRGLVTWNDGLVLETVCADLEASGYEVQPFIIPAVAVGAPHRRDRVWIIANLKHNGVARTKDTGEHSGSQSESSTRTELPVDEHEGAGSLRQAYSGRRTNANTRRKHGSQGNRSSLRQTLQEPSQPERQYPDWNRNWQEVAFATCDDTVDDGLSRTVDGVSYSRAKWRKDSLKAYGNGIVPEVAMNILQAIKESIT